MMQSKAAPKDVDAYIADFPSEVQKKLQQLRKAIKKAAPGAEECISYSMPAYKLNGMLVYFAGYKSHIGFYPTASGAAAFEKEAAAYKTGKGTLQFLLNEKLPLNLIADIVSFKVMENLQKSALKNKRSAKVL